MKQILASVMGLITELAVFNILGSQHICHFDNVEDLQHCILLSLARGSVMKDSTKPGTKVERSTWRDRTQQVPCSQSQGCAHLDCCVSAAMVLCVEGFS